MTISYSTWQKRAPHPSQAFYQLEESTAERETQQTARGQTWQSNRDHEKLSTSAAAWGAPLGSPLNRAPQPHQPVCGHPTKNTCSQQGHTHLTGVCSCWVLLTSKQRFAILAYLAATSSGRSCHHAFCQG